ncbi:L-gulonolactone oxidase-like [Physella acuta]|uniref:L-gulonolactone oxidase-like n=1 Tax=Physella acuta TaxID=109671 RepID=UPI0027DB3977|nr:L-gulonolactone oxidase-like [Physella acuta]XP_059170861.1 L-gulonolactone oxidase-like [Physella acuta]
MVNDIRTLGKSGKRFTNWAKTYTCSPELFFEPETEDEIRKILAFAQKKGKKVKVVGFGHSPSDLACTTDFMISLCRYNKVLNIDKEMLQVTVQGGCLLKDLNDNILPANDMALSVQGAVCDLTAAGVISTGTHGTGANFGIISSYVVGLTLMKASGEVIAIRKDDNPELLSVAALSLGSLGVILSVTLQCEKAFKLHCKQLPNSLQNVLENLEVYVTSSDHFRFFWYPYTDSVVCFNATRTNEEPQMKSSWIWEMGVGYYLLQVLLWISTFFPRLVPSINKLYFNLLCSKAVERIDRSDKIFNFNCLFKQYVMEWAIPRNKVAVVLYELKEWIEKNNFPAHFPVEVRFVKADNIYLSPCYMQDSCYINIIMYRPFNKLVSHETYWNEYQSIVAKHGGRPHWAKDHNFTGAEFSKLYPKWNEFCAVREKMDPNGMFLNANLERVFNTRPSPPRTYV